MFLNLIYNYFLIIAYCFFFIFLIITYLSGLSRANTIEFNILSANKMLVLLLYYI